jgi:hypothetical protein
MEAFVERSFYFFDSLSGTIEWLGGLFDLLAKLCGLVREAPIGLTVVNFKVSGNIGAIDPLHKRFQAFRRVGFAKEIEK